MDSEDGRSRPDGEKLAVALQSSYADFPIGREMDAQTWANLLTFSEPAKSATQELIHHYACTLISAAIAIKDKVKGDNVSAANVEEASFNLNRHEGSGLIKLAGVLGGILLGTGLSTLASMVVSGTFNKGGTITSVLTGATGAFFIAIDISESLSNRHKHKPTHSEKSKAR